MKEVSDGTNTVESNSVGNTERIHTMTGVSTSGIMNRGILPGNGIDYYISGIVKCLLQTKPCQKYIHSVATLLVTHHLYQQWLAN